MCLLTVGLSTSTHRVSADCSFGSLGRHINKANAIWDLQAGGATDARPSFLAIQFATLRLDHTPPSRITEFVRWWRKMVKPHGGNRKSDQVPRSAHLISFEADRAKTLATDSRSSVESARWRILRILIEKVAYCAPDARPRGSLNPRLGLVLRSFTPSRPPSSRRRRGR